VKQQIPKATVGANCWAFNVWKSWAARRNLFAETKCDPQYPVPELLENFTPEKLDYWLSLFVLEVRRQDKQPIHQTRYSIWLRVYRDFLLLSVTVVI